MKRNILFFLSGMLVMTASVMLVMTAQAGTVSAPQAGSFEIWSPRVHQPAFAMPGGSITVEMKMPGLKPAKDWKAVLKNDLRSWPCLVTKAIAGPIHAGREEGWRLTVRVPAGISPELLSLEIVNGAAKALSLRSVSIVPDFEQDFYILHQSDQHTESDWAAEPGGKASTKWGVGSKQALEWVTPVINMINPRFLMQTGDNFHLYFEYNYWCGMDSAKLRVKRFFDGFSGLSVPLVVSTGNHDMGFANYMLVQEWRQFYTQQLVGQRAFSFRMGSFYVLNTEWTTPDYLDWAKADLAKARADSSIRFHLMMAHFYEGPKGFTTVTNTGDSSMDLMLVGHNHQTRTLQTSPYYVLSTGTAQNHQQAGFFNFHRTTAGWECPQVKTHGEGVDVQQLLGNYGKCKVEPTYYNPNDGSKTSNNVRIENNLPFDFYDGRVRFLLKKGQYKVTGGKVLAEYEYNGGKNSVVLVKVDIRPNTTTTVTVEPVN